jgi:hypothetical protein
MTRRIVLSLTALAVIGTGVGVASASTHSNASKVSAPNQLCLLLYRDDPTQPQHICVNW